MPQLSEGGNVWWRGRQQGGQAGLEAERGEKPAQSHQGLPKSRGKRHRWGLAALQQGMCFNSTLMSKQECTCTELLKASHAALPYTHGHLSRPAWILLSGNDTR